ncbi:transposase [uncultured Hymenobacter sp.]|uniref:transposase n=1 Tax=uncultured Hymenobacter sp. TaxID=170016 RepID=UPI0035CBC2CB
MDNLYQDQYRVASTRLLGYDYGQNGAYFVTICTKNRQPYFGSIEVPAGNWDNAFLKLTSLGEKAAECWDAIPQFAPFVRLDAFVLMPDHLHGVILIDKSESANETLSQIFENRFGPQSGNLPSMLRGFKSAVTTFARHHHLEFQWQARFHDRVVRSEIELNKIRNYIITNPSRWGKEYENGEGLYR